MKYINVNIIPMIKTKGKMDSMVIDAVISGKISSIDFQVINSYDFCDPVIPEDEQELLELLRVVDILTDLGVLSQISPN